MTDGIDRHIPIEEPENRTCPECKCYPCVCDSDREFEEREEGRIFSEKLFKSICNVVKL